MNEIDQNGRIVRRPSMREQIEGAARTLARKASHGTCRRNPCLQCAASREHPDCPMKGKL
jgi:hypothetical protein